MGKIMGMTEQAEYIRSLEQRAQNTSLHHLDRVEAWCEWGRCQKDTFNMSRALREIRDIVKKI